MAFFRPPSKQAARQLQRSANNAAGSCAVAVAGTALAASVRNLVDAHVVEAMGTFLAVSLAELGRRAGELADDPPSKSYRSETHIRRREFDLAGLKARAYGVQLDLERYPIGAALQERAADFAIASLDCAAKLDAMVRAFERAQGAAEAGEEEYVQIRAAEAWRYSRETAVALDGVVGASSQFAEVVRSDDALGSSTREPEIIDELRNRRPLDRYLSDAALSLLYVAGVPIKEVKAFETTRASDDPWGETARAADELGSDAGLVAEDLRGWEPITL